MTEQTLDARGLKCPLPVLKARKALAALAAGDILAVLATDPAAPKDFQAFCETTGHSLVSDEPFEDGGVRRLVIRKA